MSIIDEMAHHSPTDFSVMVVSGPCRECRNRYDVEMPAKAFEAWMYNRVQLEVAWPEGSATDKAILKFCLCKDCVNA